MGYRCTCTICKNQHKGLRIKTSGRALYGSHRSCFQDAPQYGTKWSARQQQIIDGVPVNNLKRNDVTLIMRKAEQLGQIEVAQKVYEQYSYFYSEREPDDMSLEEAQKVLDKLTPDDLK